MRKKGAESPIYGRMKAGLEATYSPTIRDLEWAAGFLEGEGHFRAEGVSQTATAAQKDPECLYKLQRLFGGAIGVQKRNSKINCYVWRVCGTRARGVMMTLYSLMSARRKLQIKGALSA